MRNWKKRNTCWTSSDGNFESDQDRGGSITAELTSDHYIRSPLIQGGIGIPCKVTANISGTVINLLIMEKYIQLVQELYTEPKDEDILGSFLQADATGINAVVRVPRDVPEPKKKKNKSEVQTKDIQNFFDGNNNQRAHANQRAHSDRSDQEKVIILD